MSSFENYQISYALSYLASDLRRLCYSACTLVCSYSELRSLFTSLLLTESACTPDIIFIVFITMGSVQNSSVTGPCTAKGILLEYPTMAISRDSCYVDKQLAQLYSEQTRYRISDETDGGNYETVFR
jgi:hypothetical protein